MCENSQYILGYQQSTYEQWKAMLGKWQQWIPYLYFIPTVCLSHLWVWNIYTQWMVSGGTETNWSGVPVKSKQCGIGRLGCGGRQNVSNGFLRMDPEGDVSWKPTSCGIVIWGEGRCLNPLILAPRIFVLSNLPSSSLCCPYYFMRIMQDHVSSPLHAQGEQVT